MTTVKIDMRRITDWKSFHDVFAHALGFPALYGRNMDAWVDCMTGLDEPGTMAKVHAAPGAVVTLVLDHVTDFGARCPELLRALEDATAFVNWRRLETGKPAVLALAFHRQA